MLRRRKLGILVGTGETLGKEFILDHFFGDDFIINGELQVSRINQLGELIWDFGARDIFVLPDGGKAIKIQNDLVYLRDWEGNGYILDRNGKEVK
jgi:hypothetical protein